MMLKLMETSPMLGEIGIQAGANYVQQQAGLAVMAVFCVLAVAAAFKQKIGYAVTAFVIGAIAWFAISNAERVLSALGNLLGKLFGF